MNHFLPKPELLCLVKERCFWITHIKDQHPNRLGTTAVVAGHFTFGGSTNAWPVFRTTCARPSNSNENASAIAARLLTSLIGVKPSVLRRNPRYLRNTIVTRADASSSAVRPC